MESDQNQASRLPIGLKIVAAYLVLDGAIGLAWPLLGLGPHHPEFDVKSFAFKFGSYSRDILFDILYLVSGIGLFLRKAWARKVALVIIAIGTIYATNSFAWGLAEGKPTLNVYIISFIVVGIWNAIWFYLLYRKSSVHVLS